VLPAPQAYPPDFFRELFEFSPVATVVSRFDDATIVQVNETFVTLTGHAREDLIGRSGLDLGLWAQPDERRLLLARLGEVGLATNLVHELRRKTGERNRAVVAARRIEIGGVAHLLSQVVPLQALDRAHAALLESDARLRMAERAARFGVWEFDVASGHLEWSPGLKLLCGMAEDAVVGGMEDFLTLMHADDRERFLERRRAQFERREPFQLDYRILRADNGSVRWLRSRGFLRLGSAGEIVGTYGLVVDGTEERAREQLLQLQAQIMGNMAEGVVLVSAASSHIVFANARFEDMLGYGPGELDGRHVSLINAGHEAQAASVAMAIDAQLQRAGSWLGEVKNRRKDGTEIWCRASVSGFAHADHGNVWISVHNDVTDARLAQQARDAALLELSSLAANREESIERERAAISRDVHDHLGSILSAIRMRLEAAAAKPRFDAEACRGTMLEIAAMARSALVASREICDRLRPVILDDLGLAETVRWHLLEWSRTSGIDARYRLREPMGAPVPDAALDLYRALQELLTNVARHAGATAVRVRLFANARAIRLVVADNGRGFDAARAKGGLGLAGLRERVARHGGVLRIRSGASGSSIAVTLPMAAVP